mgnify:CR=1 FL=1
MSQSGPGARFVAGISVHSLRVVGSIALLASAAVAAASVTTSFDPAGSETTQQSAAIAGDPATVGAVVEFATVHPAYAGLFAFGLLLLVAGDEVPLLGS